MSELIDCPNCGTGTLVLHKSAGKGKYKAYPKLQVCQACWFKYTPENGRLMRVTNPSKKVRSR